MPACSASWSPTSARATSTSAGLTASPTGSSLLRGGSESAPTVSTVSRSRSDRDHNQPPQRLGDHAMKRTPIVLAATAAGLATVLGFHTQKMSSNLRSGLAGASGAGTTPTSSPSGAGSGTSTTTAAGSSSTPGPTSTFTSTTAAARTRTALGADVHYRYGELELQVTATGGRITNVQPAIDTAFDPRSSQVNSYAEPLLQSQTLQAQSANINGVSGATFTSQAYVQSLQAALDKLGIK